MENIKEFMELAKEEFIRMMPDGLAENIEIDEATVTKMNDQVLHGLVVKIKDQNSAPTMYMDEAFKRYMSGEDTLESLMTDAVQEYLNAMTNKPVEILEDLSFENIKEKLSVRLLDVKRNRQYLSDVPYVMVGNGFAYVCDIRIDSEMEGYWKTTVTRGLMENEGYDKKELFACAVKGAEKNAPATLVSMEANLFGFGDYENVLEMDEVMPDDQKDRMYVLSTAAGQFGASALFYPEIKEMIAEKLGESYYALPSSLHEFLIVPESAGVNPKDLGRMVYEANHSIVDPQDVLSDDILHYDKDSRKLETIPYEMTRETADIGRAC